MKKILVLFLAALMLFALAACSGDEDIESLKEENRKLKAQIIKLETQLNKVSDKTTPDSDEVSVSPDFAEVTLGSRHQLDFAEMIFDSAGWSDDIKPTDTSGVYSYYSDEKDESYFWLCGTLKNISGNSYSVENIHAEITFNDKYTYSAKLIADEGGNDFYGDNVKPLKTVKYYIYASCPDEVKELYTNAVVRFGFKDNFVRETSSDWEEYDNLFTIKLYK